MPIARKLSRFGACVVSTCIMPVRAYTNYFHHVMVHVYVHAHFVLRHCLCSVDYEGKSVPVTLRDKIRAVQSIRAHHVNKCPAAAKFLPVLSLQAPLDDACRVFLDNVDVLLTIPGTGYESRNPHHRTTT